MQPNLSMFDSQSKSAVRKNWLCLFYFVQPTISVYFCHHHRQCRHRCRHHHQILLAVILLLSLYCSVVVLVVIQ